MRALGNSKPAKLYQLIILHPQQESWSVHGQKKEKDVQGSVQVAFRASQGVLTGIHVLKG